MKQEPNALLPMMKYKVDTQQDWHPVIYKGISMNHKRSGWDDTSQIDGCSLNAFSLRSVFGSRGGTHPFQLCIINLFTLADRRWL